MKVKDIYTDNETKIFVGTNHDDENELNWTIEPISANHRFAITRT